MTDPLVPTRQVAANGVHPFSSCRAITMRWIWLVPS
jgi:hypothetical protein